MQLRAVRTYGEIINGAFAYVREYREQLLQVMFRICSPIIVVGVLCVGFLTSNIITYSNNSVFQQPTSSPEETIFAAFGMLSVGFIIFLLFAISVLVVHAVVMNFFAFTVKGENNFTYKEILSAVRRTIFPYLGIMIVVYIISSLLGYLFMAIVGAILMFAGVVGILIAQLVYIPLAIAISVYSSLVPYAFFIENLSLSNSLKRIISILRGQFWRTLGIQATFYLITYVLLVGLMIPVGITFGLIYLFLPAFFSNAVQDYPIVIILLSSVNAGILGFGYFIISSIITIGIGLQYTNLSERFEGLGLAFRIKHAMDSLPVINSNPQAIALVNDTSTLSPVEIETMSDVDSIDSDVNSTPETRDSTENEDITPNVQNDSSTTDGTATDEYIGNSNNNDSNDDNDAGGGDDAGDSSDGGDGGE